MARERRTACQRGLDCGFRVGACGQSDPADGLIVVWIADFKPVDAFDGPAGDVAGQFERLPGACVHAREPLQVKSKMPKLRGSPCAFATYSGFNGSLRTNGTISP